MSAAAWVAAGVAADGEGGAFVAVANDSSATWWNPAGLAAGPFFDMVLGTQLRLTPVLAPRLCQLFDDVRKRLGFEEKVQLFVGEEPSEAWAHGNAFLNPGVEDVVFCYLRFPSGKTAHMHLSWLDPHKMRKITVVGRNKMAVFDDMDLERKITVYDKGTEQRAESYGEWRTRTGDIYIPKIPNDEPLRLECRHFLSLVAGDGDPLAAARDGAVVVRVLEQLQHSLERAPA